MSNRTSTSGVYQSLLFPDLKEMLIENDHQGYREFCEALYPGVVAEVLTGLSSEEVWQVLEHCPIETQATIFEFFPLALQEELAELASPSQLSPLIEAMSADDRVDLLERLDEPLVEQLLPLIAKAERENIRKLLSYEEESAGSILTTDYATLTAGITVQEAMERLRKQAPDSETIYYIYITDENRRLRGFISLRKLILAKPASLIDSLIDRDVISVSVNDDQEQVARQMQHYGFIAIPVVDSDERLVGIITHDDAGEVLDVEAAEDQHRMAAVEPLEDDYLVTPIITLAQKRGVWLFVLLFAALLTAAVLKWLEGEAGAGNWFWMFLPLVLASGGNAGSQSAALVISALARDRSGQHGKLSAHILPREFLLGACLGGTVGVVSFALANLLVEFLPAVVVGLTVFIVVLMAAVSGAALPLMIRACKADPAYMSTPLIAALVDVLGVILYFGVATMITGRPI